MSKIFRVDWYPHQAYADYTRLDAEEIAVMSQIINLIYIHQGPIENDPKWICRSIKNMGPAKCRNIISRLLDAKELSVNSEGKIFKNMCQNQLKTVAKRMQYSDDTDSKREQNDPKFQQTDEVLEGSIEQNQTLKNRPLLSTSTSTSTSIKDKYTSDFEFFWKSWTPFKTGKGPKSEANKSYQQAVKETSHETLIRCSGEYCKFCQATDCNTKNVFRWIDKRGWEDDYTIPARRSEASNTKPSYSSTILAASERAREQLRIRENADRVAAEGNASVNGEGSQDGGLLPETGESGQDYIPPGPPGHAQEDGRE